MEIINLKGLNFHNVIYDNQGFIVPQTGDIRKLTTCIRPGHKSGLPVIYCELKDNKIISHNYGHGGVGYSILFATVNQAIENYEKYIIEKFSSINYEEEITIIGLGCIGLVTALTLYYKGFRNLRIIGERLTGTASMGAGGLFEFSLTTIYKQDQVDYMNKLFKSTFYEYEKVMAGTHKFMTKGVRYIDYYTDFYQENAGLDYLGRIGLLPKAEKVKIKFSKNAPELEMTRFKTIHINTSVLMMELFYQVKKLKIPVEFRKISSFDEVFTKSIFNCTGLGSYYLNNDRDCYPIGGHGIYLNNNDYGKYNYIFRISKTLEGTKSEGSLYFMPRNNGFIGGTYLPMNSGDDEGANKEIFKKLIERCKFVFNGIKPKF
jgi:hypothetical protein